MNVLSLFDGLSCGQLALKKAGVTVSKYFASEIEKSSIFITQKNFPNTIQLCDVTKVSKEQVDKIDILIGGSPCQSFSPAISSNTGFDGKSKLFFEFVRLLNDLNPTWFLLENVEMKPKWRDVITSYLGVKPRAINSKDFSAQDRPRLYWTNIPIQTSCRTNRQVLGDILEQNVPEKYFYKESFKIVNKGPVEALINLNGHDILKRVNSKLHKCQCLTAVCGGNQQKKVIDGNRVRKLTPVEYERLQTVPDGYTNGVSDGSRYRMLGNGWTVDVISHIFKSLTNSGKEDLMPKDDEITGLRKDEQEYLFDIGI